MEQKNKVEGIYDKQQTEEYHSNLENVQPNRMYNDKQQQEQISQMKADKAKRRNSIKPQSAGCYRGGLMAKIAKVQGKARDHSHDSKVSSQSR